MPTLELRAIYQHGGSYVVAIPKGWLRFHKLQQGDYVEILTNGDLTIRPRKDDSKPDGGR